MGITGYWLVEDRVLCLQCTGALTEADKPLLDQIVIGFLNKSKAATVHILNDVRSLTKPMPLASVLALEYLRHPKLGIRVAFGKEPGHEIFTVTNAVDQAFQRHSRNFISLDAALAFLQHVDVSLPDLQQFKHLIP